MRKRIYLLGAIALLCCTGFFILMTKKPSTMLHFNQDGGIVLSINSTGSRYTLYPYENPDDGITYFFLPSYVKNSSVYIDKPKNCTITLNGKPIKNRRSFDFTGKEVHEISVAKDGGETISEYRAAFMRSADIPAVFIETDSHDTEYLNRNKNNEDTGYIRILEENGNIQYSGKLERISGRGNSSWEQYPKKSYAIKLDSAKALLGMDAGKKWCLLPLWREEVMQSTRLAFEIAAELGLEYTPECAWADLYLNGEYNGCYLLCEAIAAGDGRVEINNLEKENKANNPDILEAASFTESDYKGYELTNGSNTDGGYLVEKDYSLYYDEDSSGFVTDSGYCFTLKSPEHASRAQVKYIRDYFQKIEDMILDGEPDYGNYIDLESFAARFLVDEITLNFDSNVTSMYFYKEENSNLLHAGPVWDYDSSMGWGKLGTGEWTDYEQSTLNPLREEELNWYPALYRDEAFYNEVTGKFEKLLPYMETLLNTTIDQYADTLRASVAMDAARWHNAYEKSNERGHYETYDNNVRYLKFFLSNRLNFLCKRWNISYKEFAACTTGEMHEIKFVHNGEVVETRQVMDGDALTELPYLDEEHYFGWSWYNAENKVYRGKLPIYEDCTFYAREK